MKIEISVSEQQLNLIEASKILKSYSISTAKKGMGCEKNSEKTPLGKHRIRAMIGKDEPINSIFVGRRKTGEIYNQQLAKQYPNRDWILTRIIWLSGKEIGKNRLGNLDTMQRYIYIHGTPDTEPMGIAKSHGCIRMRNEDLIELFNNITLDILVNIKR
jgi:lipoprotein-anchoring transpeptidase ErfK/SrfK